MLSSFEFLFENNEYVIVQVRRCLTPKYLTSIQVYTTGIWRPTFLLKWSLQLAMWNARLVNPHDSASCRHIAERFLLLPLSFLDTSVHFGTFGGGQIFRIEILVSSKIWMRKLTLRHLRQTVCIVVQTSRLSSMLLHLLQTMLEASALRTA